jgi:DNA-binding SARP family transcriptional activator
VINQGTKRCGRIGCSALISPLLRQTSEAHQVDIAVLGPVTVSLNGRSIVPTAGKPRRLLALLALRCGTVVPVSTLMEELWGEEIPRSGATTLQTYVLQIRRLIAEALPADSPYQAKDVLVTRFNGYQLMVSPTSFDARAFEQLAASGDSALELGDAAGASKVLSKALGFWRGAALTDVPTGQVLGMEAMRLEETRRRVQEQRIVADICCGRHATLIPELRMLVSQHPMNENLCALLMIAFQRSGASWRALLAFRSLRRTLIGELGVEPSARLQSLHQAVLLNAQDLSLQAYGLV